MVIDNINPKDYNDHLLNNRLSNRLGMTDAVYRIR